MEADNFIGLLVPFEWIKKRIWFVRDARHNLETLFAGTNSDLVGDLIGERGFRIDSNYQDLKQAADSADGWQRISLQDRQTEAGWRLLGDDLT